MENIVKRTLTIAFFVFCGSIANSQPTDPQTDPDNPVPITGIEVLLVGGGLLGGYKMLRRKGKK